MSIFAAILPDIVGALGRLIPDGNARAAAQEEITRILLTNEAAALTAARDVVVAEASSANWLASSWRPVLMYLLMALILWMVVVAPMFGIVGATKDALSAVPEQFWSLLMIGMGGYIVGRSGEKIAASLAGRK